MLITDLPIDVLKNAFRHLLFDEANFNHNKSVPYQFRYTSKVNHELLSISMTCKLFRLAVCELVFQNVSFVRNTEFDTLMVVRDRLRNRDILLDPINFSVSLLQSIQFLECTQSQYLQIDNSKLANLSGLKLFQVDTGVPKQTMCTYDGPNDIARDNIVFKNRLKYLAIYVSDLKSFDSVVSLMSLHELTRLDLEVDFSKFSNVETMFDTLGQVFKHSPLTELSFMSKNLTIFITLQTFNNLLVLIGSKLQKLSISKSTVSSGSNTGDSVMNEQSLGPKNVKYFYNALCELRNLTHLKFELRLLVIPEHLWVHDLVSERQNHNDTREFVLELVDMTNVVSGSQYHELLENFIVDFPFQIQKIVLHYHKVLEMSFQLALVLLTNLVSSLSVNHGIKIKYLQFNWCWSVVDERLINDYDAQTYQMKGMLCRTPKYARLDFCTPGFRVPELYRVEYMTEEVNVIQELDVELMKQAQLEFCSFWSSHLAMVDLDYYSQKKAFSRLWDS